MNMDLLVITLSSSYAEPCGNNYIDLSSGPQSVTSIGYPESYPLNIYCEVAVHAAPGYDVVVVFLDFKTEESFDYLYVSNVTTIQSVTGHRYPARLSFNSQDLWLVFVSDFITVFRGFNLSLEQSESGEFIFIQSFLEQ